MTAIAYRHYALSSGCAFVVDKQGKSYDSHPNYIYPEQEDVVVLSMAEEVATWKGMCRRHIARENTGIEVAVRRARDLTMGKNMNEEMTLFFELGHGSAHFHKRGRSVWQTTPLDCPPTFVTQRNHVRQCSISLVSLLLVCFDAASTSSELVLSLAVYTPTSQCSQYYRVYMPNHAR